MKKINLVLVIFLFISSCNLNDDSSEIELLEKESNNFLTTGDLKNIGEFHNQILENIVFDDGINKKAKTFLGKNARTHVDSLEFMRELQSYVSKYTQQLNLTAFDSILDHSEFKFSDEELIRILRDLNGFEVQKKNNNLNYEAIEWYQNQVLNLSNISESNLLIEISKLENLAKKELYQSPETLNVVLLGLSIGKYSNQFWNFSPNTKKYQTEINGRTAGWITTAYADVQGAYSWGVWGSLAGPAGTVIMGANGALLCSGAAYLADKYLP